MAFRLLALAVPDPVKTEIKIAYPERDIMACSLQPRSQGLYSVPPLSFFSQQWRQRKETLGTRLCSLVVIVFSVHTGKVINTRREVVEPVLMLFKSLILCVHPEASWN